MSIFIFLGPSLSKEEAQKILPNAHYLPPVRCGDILRLLRLKPHIIGIIDGYFEKTAAVWHKEILFGIEQGVRVVGGSSMGALRASELAKFGMQAVGNIARDYLEEINVDDDDVAVLHATKQSDYLTLTDAMVNIRHILACATKEKIIDKQVADLLLTSSKQLFYQERTLNKAIEISFKENANKKPLERLQSWLSTGGYSDLKKEDAVLVLQTIATNKFPNRRHNFKVHKPVFFRALQKNISCRPFSYYDEWLPIHEKVALASRYLGSIYRLTRRLAYLLVDCYGLAIEKNIEISSEQLSNEFSKYKFEDFNDLEKKNFAMRMAKINYLLLEEQKMTDYNTSPQDYLLYLMRLSGDYLEYKKSGSNLNMFKQKNLLKFQVMSYFSQYWWLIERRFLRLGLNLTTQTLQEHSDRFRITHKLYSFTQTEKWISDNDLSWENYQYLISANARLSIVVIQNNVDIFRNLKNDENIWWFLDAMLLTGVYQKAKDLFYHPEKIKILQKRTKRENTDMDAYAHSLDFAGENDFMNWPLLLVE